MVKAVIFDMDGVLIDTVQMGLTIRKKLLSQYGVDLNQIPDPQKEGHRAASLKTLLATVKEHSGAEIDHDEFARLSRKHLVENLQTREVDANPDLIAFLEDLKAHHVTCAIASSGLREGVDIKLDELGIRQYFSVIVTGSDTEKHKPHPDIYLHAIKEMNLAPEDCVIFEDSLTGIEAGRAAGCSVIGFVQYSRHKNSLPGVLATIRSWNETGYDKLERLLQNCQLES